jgi:hypothetical protein
MSTRSSRKQFRVSNFSLRFTARQLDSAFRLLRPVAACVRWFTAHGWFVFAVMGKEDIKFHEFVPEVFRDTHLRRTRENTLASNADDAKFSTGAKNHRRKVCLRK